MQWSKPDFQESTLNMEVTAYVNTDGEVRKQQEIAPAACNLNPAAPAASFLGGERPEG
ncbi:MAG: pyrroloquinoline quinone precursor peptide PqqA [Planctomycetes bacterium]|nr:pyrroloquinoline quinone precursor peptide PqqA [Planctomycetota bacterium]